jgi:hypothetical protein
MSNVGLSSERLHLPWRHPNVNPLLTHIMKIAIVGAGISGLSAYLFLKKHLPAETVDSSGKTIYHAYQITIYDSHAVPSRSDVSSSKSDGIVTYDGLLIRGGLGVVPNGLRVRRALDPKIYEEILRLGYSVDQFQFRNAYNGVLGSMPCGNNDRWGAQMLMCTRQAVWESSIHTRKNLSIKVHPITVQVKVNTNHAMCKQNEEATAKAAKSHVAVRSPLRLSSQNLNLPWLTLL